ncbi:transcription initiation factor TFIID subunit 2 [Saitoella complicata NRRL Y-17804]|uniref:transcription initiation factor TFIID subunit 2 n=1 Tax=Saitoella complicata (strain BCRC 22490 / CBS 7301 / JCM 7358 / NBRC 10748 / NRRL Y-17804) TaxID=698492 RepID=UPI0008682DB6|nr:transcription initiation factor TFIID subunit 2 [Saitoella complicata NRRL Y-17804]ODQ51035.1 transcription initiation factor TFIID subunit 2 [Saitoella complicata NRRL Y-17804]
MPVPDDPLRGYTPGHQRVNLDVDLANKALKGWTEITIVPTDPALKALRLNCRQIKVSAVTVNGKEAPFSLKHDLTKLKLPEGSDVHQHHLLRTKLDGVLHAADVGGELAISFPKGVRVEPQKEPLAFVTSQPMANGRSDSPIPGTPAALPTANPFGINYASITVRIDFTLEDTNMGLYFVGCEPDDKRYPHCFTTNTPIPGATSSWIPCMDGLWDRCTWEFEFTVPKTLRHLNARPSTTNATMDSIDTAMTDADRPDTAETAAPLNDAGEDIDITVICSGDQTDERSHPTDRSRKILSFALASPVAAQHIAFAIGPFTRVSLTEFRDSEEDDAMGMSAVEVLGYCLPLRESDMRNTCAFMYKAIDFFVREYGSYPFTNFKLCFVDEAPVQALASASLAICSNNMLFPADVIDRMYEVTNALTYTLASQWVGVNIVAKGWEDMWIVIGLGYYITGLFMRKLMGNNEYRFRLKKEAEEVCRQDVGRPSLMYHGIMAPFDYEALNFIALKAPVVLHILERRLTKSGGSLGLSRAIPKLFLQAMTGDLVNGCLSTAYFIRTCEKISHTKLDVFTDQWIYGTGYPVFKITQRFNRKKMVIEMTIKQDQTTAILPRPLDAENFVQEALKYNRYEEPPEVNPVFTGPMTIRIHEADGTPYDHVVEIKDALTKVDIQYNAKYKRLKRKRRQAMKPGLVVAANSDGTSDTPAAEQEIVLQCLGDVLQTEEDAFLWKLTDWTKDEEDRMSAEAFEWIRIDADFEWICRSSVNQPEHMWISQLQQDRDVIAQYEAVHALAVNKENPIISTTMIRTLMDTRYYYGVRLEAAYALAKSATEELEWIGHFHLNKAFRDLFCYENSTIPLPNDFEDFTRYHVMCAIVEAISRIRDNQQKAPAGVKQFLLDLLKYNDNSGNDYSDAFYLAKIMGALAATLVSSEAAISQFTFDFGDNENNDAGFSEVVVKEIERCQRMDQWLPSYQNIISRKAIEVKETLTKKRLIKPNFKEYLAYTQEENFDPLRMKAFEALIDLGALRQASLAKYVFFALTSDPSPVVRRHLVKTILRGFGDVAIGGRPQSAGEGGGLDDMIIEEESGDIAAEERRQALARANPGGAIDALQREIAESDLLKKLLWDAANSTELDLLSRRDLLDLCQLLFTTKDSYLVKLKLPKPRLRATYLGKGKIVFRKELPWPRPPKKQEIKKEESPATPVLAPTIKLKLPTLKIKLGGGGGGGA